MSNTLGNFDYIVGPNQTVDIRPKGTDTKLRAAQPVLLPGENARQWGGSGNSIFKLQAHVKQDVNNDRSDEISRTYDVVRVQNPDDEDQYVEVEQMTEYQARNKIDQSRITLRFAKPTSSGNIKVLSSGNIRTSTPD